jgi:hypothetical protein
VASVTVHVERLSPRIAGPHPRPWHVGHFMARSCPIATSRACPIGGAGPLALVGGHALATVEGHHAAAVVLGELHRDAREHEQVSRVGRRLEVDVADRAEVDVADHAANVQVLAACRA